MRYELLIATQGPARGRVVHAQLVPATWGVKEGPPQFVRRTVELLRSPVGAMWDFASESLVGMKAVVRSAKYTEPTIRNLLYHVHIADNDIWIRNLLQLKQRIGLFNGRKLVGCTGDPTHVRDILPYSDLEVIHIPNDPALRSECNTLRALLPLLNSVAPEEATFFSHTKGVSRTASTARACEYWRNAMYHVLLDDWPCVSKALTTHTFAGAFQRVTNGVQYFPSRLRKGSWHYAGGFYWFRHDNVFSSPAWHDIPYDRYGAECWPGVVCEPTDGYTLHQPTEDPLLDLYDESAHQLRIADPVRVQQAQSIHVGTAITRDYLSRAMLLPSKLEQVVRRTSVLCLFRIRAAYLVACVRSYSL
jgi:hypothetical protein